MELVVVGVLKCSGELLEEVEKLRGGLIGERRFGKPAGRTGLIHREGLVV